MAKEVFIEIPNSGSLQDLANSLVSGFEKLPREDQEQFRKEAHNELGKPKQGGPPWPIN